MRRVHSEKAAFTSSRPAITQYNGHERQADDAPTRVCSLLPKARRQ